MEDPFRSARLLYRAAEPTEDEAFFLNLQQDPIALVNANAILAKPQAQKDAASYIKHLEDSLLGVVICLPPPSPTEQPVPIGAMHLRALSPHMVHHRFTEIAIDIVKAHQGQGYGSEAIRWILDWAFDVAGMHRVSISCLGWNAGARKLYERLGFKLEGVARETFWWRGRWWDDVRFGMLEGEWRALTEKK